MWLIRSWNLAWYCCVVSCGRLASGACLEEGFLEVLSEAGTDSWME